MKTSGETPEALGKALDLPHVQISLARHHFRYDAPAPDLGKVGLPILCARISGGAALDALTWR